MRAGRPDLKAAIVPGGITKNADNNGKERTPDTHPDDYDPVRGCPAKCNRETGEIWEKDLLHKDHWEVYKNTKITSLGNEAGVYGVMEDLKGHSNEI